MYNSSLKIEEWLPENFDWLNLNYTEIINRRTDLASSLFSSEDAKAGALYFYSKNPVEFIRDWVWCHEPRERSGIKVIPLIPFNRQIEFCNWFFERYENQESGVVVKSREMGISWVCCALAVWIFLFVPGSRVLFASFKEDKVDRHGDMDSLFEKIRHILKNLPDFFLPPNIHKNLHHMRIVNPSTGASITGEAGDNIGRGGRATVVFIDEVAMLENPMSVESALSMTSDIKIWISTVRKPDDYFYNMYLSRRLKDFVFHWKEDPRKNEEWYEKQKKQFPAIVVATEIDINPTSAFDQRVIPIEWIRAAVEFPLFKTGDRIAGLDVADNGNDQNAFVIRQGPVIESILEWDGVDVVVTGKRAFNLCRDRDVTVLNYDRIGVGAGIRGTLNSLKSSSASFKLNYNGIHVQSPPRPGFYKKSSRNRDTFKNIKAQMWFELRDRFEKTYKQANNEADENYSQDELISIPNDSGLISELAAQEYEIGNDGKIVITSKKSQRAQGMKSPNKADGLLLSLLSHRESIVELI